jgi:hypothetical protein
LVEGFGKTQKIKKNRSFFYNVNSLYPLGCKSIIDFIDSLENQKPISIISSKPPKTKNYFSYPTQENLKDFSKIMKLF